MTAVNPKRLRFQIDDLVSFYHSPLEFHQQLQHLFSLYANRALRFGDSNQPRPYIPMYHLPQPVTRQLELDLRPYIINNSQPALNLADELWQDDYFEIKQTAGFILGIVPIEDPDQIQNRLKSWLTPELDNTLTAYLFSRGTLNLQASFPEKWESFIDSFLREENPKIIALGILGLTEGMKNPSFKNLPTIFRLISSFVQDPNREILKELLGLIKSLAKSSPTETAFFLKQTLSISNSSETARLVKKCLEMFPENIQKDLRTTLRE